MAEKMEFINLAQNEMKPEVARLAIIGQTSDRCSKAEAVLEAGDCKVLGAWTSGM